MSTETEEPINNNPDVQSAARELQQTMGAVRVPISVTSGEQIENLRNWAAGRCLSADNPGLYTRVGRKSVATAAGKGRRLAGNGATNN